MTKDTPTAQDNILFLLGKALNILGAGITQTEEHERAIQGAVQLILATTRPEDLDQAGQQPLLPAMMGLIQFDIPDEMALAPLFERFGMALFNGPGGRVRTARTTMADLLERGMKTDTWAANNRFGKAFSWMIRHAPKETLEAWDTKEDTPGAGLVLRLLGNAWGWEALGALKERGVEWTAARRGNTPVGEYIHLPEQWTAFIAQGGDALLPTKTPSSPDDTPLWRRLLLDRTISRKFRETLEKWLENQEPTEEAQRAAEELSYWSGFSKAPANRAGMLHHLVSIEGWSGMSDTHGAPAWAHATSMIPSTMTTILRGIDGCHAMARRDVFGRSPWFYILPVAGENHVPSHDEIERGLAGLGEATKDQEGRGLLFCVAEAEMNPSALVPNLRGLFGRRNHPSPIKHVCPPEPTSGPLAHLSGEDWAGGTVEQHDALAARLLDHQRPQTLARLVKLIAKLPRTHPLLSPRLKGAVLLIALRIEPAYGMDPGLEGFSLNELAKGSKPPGPPLSWLYEGETILPEDAGARYQRGIQAWIEVKKKAGDQMGLGASVSSFSKGPQKDWLEKITARHLAAIEGRLMAQAMPTSRNEAGRASRARL